MLPGAVPPKLGRTARGGRSSGVHGLCRDPCRVYRVREHRERQEKENRLAGCRCRFSGLTWAYGLRNPYRIGQALHVEGLYPFIL